MNTTRDFGDHLHPPPSARGEVSGVFRIQPMHATSEAADLGRNPRNLAGRLVPGPVQPSTRPSRTNRMLSAVLRWIRDI